METGKKCWGKQRREGSVSKWNRKGTLTGRLQVKRTEMPGAKQLSGREGNWGTSDWVDSGQPEAMCGHILRFKK